MIYVNKTTIAANHEVIFLVTFNGFTDDSLYWAERHFLCPLCSWHKWQL